MSSKKLLEQCQKLEKLWGHVLTGKYHVKIFHLQYTEKYLSPLKYLADHYTAKYFRYTAASLR